MPHGMAVSLTAPEAFRFTFEAAPERHLRAARLPARMPSVGDDPDVLPPMPTDLMRDIGLPPGWPRWPSVETVLLILTLFVSGFTFGGGRTNVLQGVVHLLLFIVYVALIFSP